MDSSKIAVVLLVEDDPGDQKLVKNALANQEMANELYIVGTGEEALEYLQRSNSTDAQSPRPNLILLDLNMPGMGGKEFLRCIKADDDLRSIPVVILTVSDSEIDIQESYKLWGITIDDEAIKQTIRLTDKYLSNDNFPRKAINILDEAVSSHKLNGDPNDPVDAETVGAVLEQMTGIPTAKLLQTEVGQLLEMENIIEKKIIGQTRAVKEIAKSIRRSKAAIRKHKRPIGSFLFLGPTGVGKTELAKQLAAFMFNDEREIIRLDMSEFREPHTYMRLIGAPPSYVGYDQGGELTEALKKKPHCVLLLDEIEKAASNIFDLLLHILDEGRLTSSKGELVDCRNAVIIMTSNIGSQEVANQPDADPRKIYQEEIKKKFRPEFINRIDRMITFNSLTRTNIRNIIDIKVEEINGELLERGLKIKLTPAAAEIITDKGYSPEYGARPLDRALQQLLEDELAGPLLNGQFNDGDTIQVDASGEANDKLVFAAAAEGAEKPKNKK